MSTGVVVLSDVSVAPSGISGALFGPIVSET